MPQLAGGGGGGDPELCATDEMIPFKDEGDPHKEQIFAEINHSEEEGDLAEIKSSLVNETEISPNSNSHDAARQSQIPQDSYHEKHRDLQDDGKHQDMYNKGHPYPGYPGYIMMNMNNDSYMTNGSLSPPMPRTSNKVPVVQPSHAVHPLTPLITYSDEHFAPGPHSGHHPQDMNAKQGKQGLSSNSHTHSHVTVFVYDHVKGISFTPTPHYSACLWKQGIYFSVVIS